MNLNRSIQLKAVLLLVVFGLNTLIGFACSVGMDLGINKSHHHGKESSEVHLHKDGKKHHHDHPKKSGNHSQKHKEKKDDCCTDSVAKLSQSDKSVPQTSIILSPLFFSAFISCYYNIDIFFPSQVTGSIKYFVRNYHPPIADIRIAIQSFQI